MRNLIILALSLGLVMASGQAFAESKIKFSGFYKVYHENNVNFLRSSDSDHRDAESYFWHRLQLTIDFTPNEDVNVRWVLRGPNAVRWGQVPYGDATGANVAGRPLDVYTRAIYATINSDYGKLVIGRHNATMVGNVAGLETLGYNQRYGDFLVLHAFDWNLPFDGITYSKLWDNGFGIHVLYVKERSDFSQAALYESDNDSDRFGVEPFYKWDGGGVSLLASYAQDKSPAASYTTGNDVYKVDDNWTFFLNPALILTWGDFSLHFEGKVAWGETTYDRRSSVPNGPRLTANKIKDEGLGLYLDGVYKYDQGAVTLAGWFLDGNGPDDGGGPRPGRKKGHELVGIGNFSPFLVAYGSHNGLATGNAVNILGVTGQRGSPNKYRVANHWAIGLLGDHDFTKDVRFHWGLGYFRAVKPRARHLVGYNQNNQEIWADDSKELGYEADIGVIAKLLDNVTFESHFGYFVNGAAFKTYDNANPGHGEKAKDTYAWANALIFTF
jgi:hypothetical protein